jgi:3-isopropylmalate/(R)-2-methylmalate dehydratase small subunit
LICNTDSIDEGDELEIDLEAGTVNNLTNGSKLTFSPLPGVMLNILEEGGLLPYLARYGGFDRSSTKRS